MPSLRELSDNVASFNYYSGTGNFSQNNIQFPDPRPFIGPESTLMLKPKDFRWSPANFDDGLVPFGAVTRIRRAADDTIRIGKYLASTISGWVFTKKQQWLQTTNPEIEYDPATSNLNKYGPTRLYSPLPMLAQIAGNAVGARFMRHGLLPKQSQTQDYENYILKLNEGKAKKNRLVRLVESLSYEASAESIQNYVLKYPGGPGSFYGIGETRIKRYGNVLLPKKTDSDNGFVSIPISDLLLIDDTRTIIKKIPPQNVDTGDPITRESFKFRTQDFRQYKNRLITSTTDPQLPFTNYGKYNLENRIGIAGTRTPTEIGTKGKEKEDVGSADRVNLLSLYYSMDYIPKADLSDFNKRPIQYSPSNGVSVRDIIKFFIKSINNDKPSHGIYIVFRAYLTNIKRSIQSKWNPYSYVGRGESFYLYDGVTETITVSFNVIASSRVEMKSLYQKLNYLISTLAPDYSADGKMRGNLSELTIGNFIIYQPGIITNFDMTIDEDSNWDIAMTEPEGLGAEDSDMLELPQLIKCSLSFIPIYNFLPKKGLQVPFIGIDNYEGVGKNQRWLRGNVKLNTNEI